MKFFSVVLSAFAAMFLAGAALAAGGHGDHGAHDGAAHGIGVLNAVHAEAGKVNISHGPVPALNWPEMTMDLPVAEIVDLKTFEAGQKVQFAVLPGEDEVYLIMAMCATDGDEVVEGLCDGHHDDGQMAGH